MPIDKDVLGLMLQQAPKDLANAIKSVNSITAQIAQVTGDQNLYLGIMAKDKTDLEARLALKLTTLPTTTGAWQATHTYSAGEVVRPTVANGYVYYTAAGGTSAGVEPTWPTTPGDDVDDDTVNWVCQSLTVSYGSSYGVSNITDWQILMQPSGVSIYQYQNTIVDARTYSLGSDSNGMRTVRNIVTGLSQSLDWVRIGIQAHSTYMTTVVNVSIGERDGSTQNIVPGTHAFFKFYGSERININPGLVEYSDWLDYSIDNAKTYFITMFIESAYHTSSGADQYYYRMGDYSLEENWGTSGSGPIGITRSIKVIQGWLSGPGQGWDGDVYIVRYCTHWQSMYPMVYNSTFGTTVQLSALNTGLGYANTWKSMVTNRNPALPYYQVFTIETITKPNGSISPSGSVQVNYGDNQTFTITPDGGYSIQDVVVDGVSQGAIPSYTFTNVQGNEHTIVAYFE